MKKTISILSLLCLILSCSNSKKETLSLEEYAAYGHSTCSVVKQFSELNYRWPSSPQELQKFYEEWAIDFLQGECGMTEEVAKQTLRDSILNYTFNEFPEYEFYGFPLGRFVCLNFLNKHPNVQFQDKDSFLVIVDSTVTVRQDDGTEKFFCCSAFSDIFSPAMLYSDLEDVISEEEGFVEEVVENQPVDKSREKWQLLVEPAHVNDFIPVRTQVYFFDKDDNPYIDSTLTANFFKGIREELWNIDVKSRFVGLPMIYEEGKGLSIACKRYHHFKNEINGWDTLEKCIERFAKENNIKQINFSDAVVGVW